MATPLEPAAAGQETLGMAPQAERAPVLMTSFETDVLDTGAIHDKLIQLWTDLGGPPRGGGESSAETIANSGGVMRANTLNLLAVARSDDDANLIRDAIAQLHDFLPSRTIILVTRDPADGNGASRFRVDLKLNELQRKGDGPKPYFETVTIRAATDETDGFASFVSPLLLAELPDILWWPGSDFARNPLFLDLQGIVDRVIVDSAQLGRDITGIRNLIDPGDETAPILGDFTWLRLAPWRQLIAQFFDPPDVQESLGTIDEITIAYADTRSDGSSGLASALLIVGWLASRLGWEIIDPLERRRTGGWSAPLRAQVDGRQREIALRLLPDRSPQATFSLRRVEIVAAGEAPGTFTVERSDQDDLITSSETRTIPLVSRMVYARRPTNAQMLREELHRFGRDRVYEESLAFATDMLA